MRGKIVPINSSDREGSPLKVISLSFEKEIILGRGRNTGIADQSISRNQLKVCLRRFSSDIVLHITPLTKPCKILRNSVAIEIQKNRTEIVRPNETFYMSRSKVPYQFIVTGKNGAKNKKIVQPLKKRGKSIEDDIQNNNDTDEQIGPNFDNSVNEEMGNKSINDSKDSIDDPNSINTSINNSSSINDSNSINTSINNSNSINDSNSINSSVNTSINDSIVEENLETVTEIIQKEDKEKGGKEEEIENKNDIKKEEDKIDGITENEICISKNPSNTTENVIIEEKVNEIKIENTITPIDLKNDPAFTMLLNKVTVLEEDITTVLNQLNAKLNNLIERANIPENPPTSLVGKRKREPLGSKLNIPNKLQITRKNSWSDPEGRIFSWAGFSKKENFGVFYTSVNINGEIYDIGDTVYMISPVVPHYIGKILALWEDNSGDKFVQITWFFYYYDVQNFLGVAVAKKMGVEPTERKVYGSIQTDNNPVITIHKKNDVKHLSELSPEDASAPNAWASQSPHRYYYDKYFDSRTKKISFTPNIDQLNLVYNYPAIFD